MRGLKIITIRGIPVILHWTFLIFIALLGVLVAFGDDGGEMPPQVHALFLLMLFICLIAHELMHSLVARRYGIPVHAIWLTPIGGLASMDRMPEDPGQEIRMSIAGPAFNLAAAFVLYQFMVWLPRIEFALEPWNPLSLADVAANDTLFTQGTVALFKANLMLGIFNLLPAFPMDGGRILRAWLTMRGGNRAAATLAAWRVSIFFLVLLGFLGLVTGLFGLVIIAGVLAFMGQAEVRHVRRTAPMRGLTAGHLLPQEPVAIEPGMTLGELVPRLLDGVPRHYPVVSRGRVVGLLAHPDIAAGLARAGGPDLPVSAVMRPPLAVDAGDSLEAVGRLLAERDSPVALILDRTRLVGLVSREMLDTLGRQLEEAPAP